jgi:glycosyltransferase involved in cell wall biosynthesis
MVDHTAKPGGAELGLVRLVSGSRHAIRALLLEDGPIGEMLSGHEPAAMILPSTSVWGRLRGFLGLRRVLRESRGVVVSNTLRASLYVTLCRRRPTHVVMLRDGLDAQSLSFVKRQIARWTMRRADHIVANSAWTASTLPSDAAPVSVVHPPSGISDAALESLPASTPRGEREPLNIVWVGRIVPWKGLDVLIDAVDLAAAQLPEGSLSVTVVGSAVMGRKEYVSDLRHRCERAGLPIRFVGQKSDVAPYVERADVLVHTSVTPEPYGQVIVQGIGGGAAVLSSPIGGPPEILGHDAPEAYFAAGDSIELAARLVALAGDQELVHRIHRAQAVALASLTDEAVIAEFDAVIDRFLPADPEAGAAS